MSPKAGSLLFALPLALACAAEPPPAAKDSPRAGSSAEQAADEAPPAEGQPKIASSNATYEFGTLRPHEKVTHVFTIENQGEVDLHIERVRRT